MHRSPTTTVLAASEFSLRRMPVRLAILGLVFMVCLFATDEARAAYRLDIAGDVAASAAERTIDRHWSPAINLWAEAESIASASLDEDDRESAWMSSFVLKVEVETVLPQWVLWSTKSSERSLDAQPLTPASHWYATAPGSAASSQSRGPDSAGESSAASNFPVRAALASGSAVKQFQYATAPLRYMIRGRSSELADDATTSNQYGLQVRSFIPASIELPQGFLFLRHPSVLVATFVF